MKLHTLALAALILAGCYNPSFKEGLACGPGGSCPDGTSCGADNTCRGRGGELPDASTDAPPDAISCTANTTACDARGHIVTCNASGTAASDVACPLGCSASSTACSRQKVSNGLDQFLLDAVQSADMVFPLGTTVIKASTGDVTINNAAVVVPSQLVGNIRVFAFHSLKINGVVQFTKEFSFPSAPAIAFVVDGPVQITRLLDVSGNGDFYGPGALDTQAATDALCIGGRGGHDNVSASAKGGGGGAGGFHAGAAGGASQSFAGGTAGPQKFDDTLVPLHGGCAGGLSGSQGGGGGGGGAIQIVSATSIELTDLGQIDASAGGGAATPQTFSDGAGGGGGGAILLEAPTVAFRGAGVVLSTKGAGGGGTGVNNNGGIQIARGEDGGLGEAPALGGFQVNPGGFLHGGNGATATVAATVGPSSGNDAGAGGGGGVGQARFNTRDGTVTIDGAALRTPFVVGTLTILAP